MKDIEQDIVYIVLGYWNYEGRTLRGIFKDLETAKKFKDSEVKRGWDDVEIRKCKVLDEHSAKYTIETWDNYGEEL